MQVGDPSVHALPVAGYDRAQVMSAVESLLRDCGALATIERATRVVLKPNWVHHHNPLGHDCTSLITHGAVVEAVADIIAARLPTGASVIIGDAPVQSANFSKILSVSGINEAIARLTAKHHHVSFACHDWRLVRAKSRLSWSATERVDSWNPNQHELVDVGSQSFLEEVSEHADRFRVTCYAPSTMQARHRQGVHQYLIAREALDADVVINLPKLKTHIKAGVTCALKNLVGINGHKEFLPHHVTGSPSDGGDSHASTNPFRAQFERYYDFHFEHLVRLPRPLISLLSRGLTAADRVTATLDPSNFGSWPGNDTVWRMTLDLNHLLYAWSPRRPRSIFTLVDAITVGVGNGPLSPSPAFLGLLLAGQNPATIDATAASIMGFEPRALPTIRNALDSSRSIFRTDFALQAGLPSLTAKRPINWEHVAAPPGP